jgi:hypothetical protein
MGPGVSIDAVVMALTVPIQGESGNIHYSEGIFTSFPGSSLGTDVRRLRLQEKKPILCRRFCK